MTWASLHARFTISRVQDTLFLFLFRESQRVAYVDGWWVTSLWKNQRATNYRGWWTEPTARRRYFLAPRRYVYLGLRWPFKAAPQDDALECIVRRSVTSTRNMIDAENVFSRLKLVPRKIHVSIFISDIFAIKTWIITLRNQLMMKYYLKISGFISWI